MHAHARGAIYAAAFMPAEALAALELRVGSRAGAEQALRGMQRARLLSVVLGPPDADPAGSGGPGGGARLLRLVADAPRPRLGQPLNAHFAWAGAARPALQVRV